jgi:cephalosporin hydroxylase
MLKVFNPHWKIVIARIKRTLLNFILSIQRRMYGRYQSCYDKDLTFSEATLNYPDPNSLFVYIHHYFYHICPQRVREHRFYFSHNSRGFGENAFHAMWWLLLREHHPKLCLEIGVYRGQVISLWALIAQILKFPCEIHGISPFTPIGDGVSTYRKDVDYLTDTLKFFKLFNLPAPTLVKALSTDPVAIEHINSHSWDLIYIDGSHDYGVILADYRLCRDSLVSGGLLIIDDASLGTSFRPPRFSFAGHPGPSRVAAEFAMKEMKFLGAVGHNNVFQKS